MSDAGGPPELGEAELARMLRRSGVSPPPEEIRRMLAGAATLLAMLERVNPALPLGAEPAVTFTVLDGCPPSR